MTTGGWICLAGAAGRGRADHPRRLAHLAADSRWLATLSVAVSFGGALWSFADMLGKDVPQRHASSTAYTWLTAGTSFQFPLNIYVDQISVWMMLIVSGIGMLIVLYSIGYMDGADEERRYFAYMALFVFSMLLLVEAGNLLILLAGLGPRRALLVLADRIRARAAGRDRRSQEGVHHERVRRRDHGARPLRARLADRHARLPRRLRAGAGRRPRRRRHPRRPGGTGPARRRSREIRPDPAAYVAAGRHGGPDPGQRPHPRGHDGDRRRLPDRAHARDLRGGAARPRSRRRPRRGHAARRRADRARPDGHQEGDRLLDDVADRLHVRRGRHRRVLDAGCST